MQTVISLHLRSSGLGQYIIYKLVFFALYALGVQRNNALSRHIVGVLFHGYIRFRHGIPSRNKVRHTPSCYRAFGNPELMSPQFMAEILHSLRVVENDIQLGIQEKAAWVGIR